MQSVTSLHYMSLLVTEQTQKDNSPMKLVFMTTKTGQNSPIHPNHLFN
jgi:hypothetical protein